MEGVQATYRAKKSRARALRGGLLVVAAIVFVALTLLVLLLTSSMQDGLRRGLYPLEYGETIRTASAEQGVEPALVAAVIHNESGFDPEAVSDQNAYGLMQILPSTAEVISQRSGIQGDFREPRVNIRMGVWYLAYLQERYAGSERLALAAYNAGEGTVDTWLQEESFDIREDIPYPETASYVVDVRETRDAYAELYGSDLRDVE